MRSATAFLPDSMMTFMNLDRSTEPNFGSGRISRLGTSRRRGISLFLCLQLARAHRRRLGHHLHLGPPTYSASPFGLPKHASPSLAAGDGNSMSQAFLGRLAPYL